VTSMDEQIKLGVTLYSFNTDFFLYRRSFEDCLAAVGSIGPGQGIEIVAPQMMRGFPDVSEESQQTFLKAVDEHGLVPTCYGGYSDPGITTGRDMTHEEQTEYLKAQLNAAKRLGFPIVRVAPCEPVFTNLVPYAEKLGVKMGIEIHAPRVISRIGDTIERVEKVDSAHLGWVPDWGIFCHSVPDVYLQRFRQLGVSQEIADRVVALWEEQADESTMHAEVAAMGGGHLEATMVAESQVYFGHSKPEELRRLMPYVMHTHGKFFYVDDEGVGQGARAPEVIAELRDGGYTGWISAEWEGHRWTDPDQVDALDQVKRQQALIRRELAARQPVAG
jgi:sugar phosphate isomerase/epimerase